MDPPGQPPRRGASGSLNTMKISNLLSSNTSDSTRSSVEAPDMSGLNVLDSRATSREPSEPPHWGGGTIIPDPDMPQRESSKRNPSTTSSTKAESSKSADPQVEVSKPMPTSPKPESSGSAALRAESSKASTSKSKLPTPEPARLDSSSLEPYKPGDDAAGPSETGFTTAEAPESQSLDSPKLGAKAQSLMKLKIDEVCRLQKEDPAYADITEADLDRVVQSIIEREHKRICTSYDYKGHNFFTALQAWFQLKGFYLEPYLNLNSTATFVRQYKAMQGDKSPVDADDLLALANSLCLIHQRYHTPKAMLKEESRQQYLDRKTMMDDFDEAVHELGGLTFFPHYAQTEKPREYGKQVEKTSLFGPVYGTTEPPKYCFLLSPLRLWQYTKEDIKVEWEHNSEHSENFLYTSLDLPELPTGFAYFVTRRDLFDIMCKMAESVANDGLEISKVEKARCLEKIHVI